MVADRFRCLKTAYCLHKTLPEHPAELAVITAKGKRQLTHLNAMDLGKKQLGKVEKVWYTSSYDQRHA